jgi:hypothetical protein
MCSAQSYWQRTPGVKSPVQYSRAIQLELKITTNLPQLLQSTESPVTIQEGGSVKMWIESNFPLSTRHCFLQPGKPCQPYAFSVNMATVDLTASGCTLDATPVQFARRESSSLTVAPVQTIGRRAAPFTVPVNFNDLDQTTFQESILSGHKPKAVPITIVDNEKKPECSSIYDPHITQFGNTTYHIINCCGCYTLLKSKCPGPTCRDFEIQVITHPWSTTNFNAANCAIAIREGTYLITIDACKQSEPPYYRMTQERLGGEDDGTLPKPTLVTIDPMQWKITLLSGIEVVVQLYKTSDLVYGNLNLYVTGLAGDEYEGLCAKDTNENNYDNSKLATCSNSLFYNKTACYKQATAQRRCACPVGAGTDVCPATDDGSTGLPTFTSQGAGVCNDGQTTTTPQVTAMSAITISGQTFLIPSGDLLSQKSFEEFDVELKDDSKHQWPTPNLGITEADARNACQKALQDQAVYSQCVQFVNIQPIIESCMLDIQLTESVSFVPSYGEQFASLCRHEVAAGVVSNGTAAEDAERVALLQNIESKICPRQCRYDNVVRGTCQNGACLCYEGYAGSDCSIEANEPPSSVKAITEFIDHKGFSSNHTFIVVLSASNINTAGQLDCRIERVKGEKLPPLHSVPPAAPISGGMVACIIQTDEKLTDALYRMKISISNGVAEPVRRKRRSADGATYSDPVVVTLYDGNCVSCSKGRDCASLDGWCIRKEVCTKIDDSTKGNCKQLVPTTTRSPHSKPTTPSKPNTHSTPSKPTTRSAPSKPTTRSAPSKPTTRSAPSKPTTRSVPSKPTTRSTPSKPTTRSAPSKPTTRRIAYG